MVKIWTPYLTLASLKTTVFIDAQTKEGDFCQYGCTECPELEGFETQMMF